MTFAFLEKFGRTESKKGIKNAIGKIKLSIENSASSPNIELEGTIYFSITSDCSTNSPDVASIFETFSIEHFDKGRKKHTKINNPKIVFNSLIIS